MNKWLWLAIVFGVIAWYFIMSNGNSLIMLFFTILTALFFTYGCYTDLKIERVFSNILLIITRLLLILTILVFLIYFSLFPSHPVGSNQTQQIVTTKEPEAQLKAELVRCSFGPITWSTAYNYAYEFDFNVTNIGDKPTKLPSFICLESQSKVGSSTPNNMQCDSLSAILAKGDSIAVNIAWLANSRDDLQNYDVRYVEGGESISQLSSLILEGFASNCL